MSFQTLPPELFLHVLRFLEQEEDRSSLRITCRKFRKFSPPQVAFTTWPGIHLHSDSFYPHRTVRVPSRLKYMSRLLLPGNIFHERHAKVEICGNCCLIRPSTKFPLDMVRDGYRICEECLMKFLLDGTKDGAWIVYKEKTHKSCYSCQLIYVEEDIRCCFGYTDGGTGVHVCEECHYYECLDPRCSGLETKDLLQKQYRFCTGEGGNYKDKESCGHCDECLFIEALRHSKEAKSQKDSDSSGIKN